MLRRSSKALLEAASLALLLSSCGSTTTAEGHAAAGGPPAQVERTAPTVTPANETHAEAAAPAPHAIPPVAGRCAAPLPIYEQGAPTGEVCPDDAAAAGLTVVDLSDSLAPFVFSEDPALGEAGEQPYRQAFLALADERLEDVPAGYTKGRYLELFGIFPTFRVLRARLADEERHTCHDAVEDEAVEALDRTMRAWGPGAEAQRRRIRLTGYLRARLERVRGERELGSIDDLADDPTLGPLLERLRRERVPVDAVIAMQGHLACDRLLRGRFEAGVFGWRTAAALDDFHRMHMILSGPLFTEGTRAALRLDSRESDFRALLRALRERVVAATGLIEDGSARREWGTVLGRDLDPPELRSEAGQPAAPNGAPDLISPATEAAAEALGWGSPSEAMAFFAGLPPDATRELRIALRLPPLPAYHSGHMELRAEIDRGDVWYMYPYTPTGGVRSQRVVRRPVTTLFVRDGDREVALVRWATTIGGWKPENLPDGGVGLRYKNSPAGPVVWRDVVASPAWLPPPSTPDEELVRRSGGSWVPNHDLFGPGYRSAYGLAMLMHHKVVPPREEDGEPRFVDEGVRSHGSVSYRSILRGTSHGCHRLYNHLAVRLTSFVLAHRQHVRAGSIRVRYARTARHEGHEVSFRIESRGYRFELTPPVPVMVLEGNLRGPVRQPSQAFRRLREDLVAEALAAAAEEG